jgi:outer membrane protein assembly factor BamA
VEAGDWAAREEVDGDVRRLYSTQFFERVTYRLESGPEGTHLVLRVVEHRADHLRFGFHYNSQTKVAALINYTRNNLLFDGSLATLDLRLGQTNAQEVAWFLPVPGMRRYGLRARFAASETKDVALPVDTLGGFFKYDREHTESELLAGTLFSTRAVLGAGLRSYWDLYDPQTEDPAELRRFRREVSMLEAYGLYYYDTLDRLYFPTSGSRLHLEAAHSLHDFVEASQYYRWLLEGSANIALAPRVTLEASLTLGYFSNPEISPTPRFSFGGDASFFGADFGELHGDAVQVLRGAVRWEAFQRAFIGSQVNVGRASSRWRWMDGAALEYGYGLVLGYLTPFGPIMWQVHRGSRSDARTFLQVGYSF